MTHSRIPRPFSVAPVDHDREYIAGRIIREACDYDPKSERMYLTCSVGELAQRVVVALAEKGGAQS